MQQELKKFNQDIQVTLSVDSIANQMMKAMDSNNPHSALIVNTVIGTSLNTGKLGFLYNALNGWVDEINVTAGKHYLIPGKYLNMYRVEDQVKAQDIEVLVLEIDEYRDTEKIRVQYSYMQKDKEEPVTSTDWVKHTQLIEKVITLISAKEELLAEIQH